MKLIFEGGGQNDALKTEARRAFTTLLEKAQVTRKPRTVAAGGRDAAYKSFSSQSPRQTPGLTWKHETSGRAPKACRTTTCI